MVSKKALDNWSTYLLINYYYLQNNNLIINGEHFCQKNKIIYAIKKDYSCV